MLKKIIYCNITFFLFALSTSSQSAESSGMPQLDPKFWISQIFWLILSFGVLFFVLSKFILPKISGNLEARRSQILENIENADQQRKNSEKKTKQYEDAILKSQNESKKYFNEAKQKILSDIRKKNDDLENQINQEIKSAENEILKLKHGSTEKINKIAIETSHDLIKQLIGTEVNNSSISAIVIDLSKKNKDKFYEI